MHTYSHAFGHFWHGSSPGSLKHSYTIFDNGMFTTTDNMAEKITDATTVNV